MPVGLSVDLEENVPEFKFLDSLWKLSGYSVNISMHNHNMNFCIGAASEQSVTRVIPFQASFGMDRQYMCRYFAGRMARIQQFSGQPVDERRSYLELVFGSPSSGLPASICLQGFLSHGAGPPICAQGCGVGGAGCSLSP